LRAVRSSPRLWSPDRARSLEASERSLGDGGLLGRVEPADLPIRSFRSPQSWEEWLDKRGSIASGLWIKIAKSGSGIDSVTYAEALEIALCHGWIDGQKKKLDDDHWLQRFTPRTSRSKWSKVNCGKAQELIDQGRMKPAGLREVESAKADGRWDAAYDASRTMTVPPDLQLALDANAEAKEFFVALDRKNRYAVLYRIQDAKKPETRLRRIEKYVAMLANKEKIYP
jgi:uncharacterized protein YdeI (YjbR/CyaY-like superfamily)